MITCSCSTEGDICPVGKQKFVTCRKGNKCDSCNEVIKPGDKMYMQSYFDYFECLPSRPLFHCEECGDLMNSLDDYDICYSPTENIFFQWYEYLLEVDSKNPALKTGYLKSKAGIKED